MNNPKSKFVRVLIATLAILSMCTMTVFGASTAKATKSVRFRTAVVNKLTLGENASAQVIRGDKTLDAFEGMRLESGDTIRTTGDAMLYILVDQNKIIRLGKDTEAVLEDTILGRKVRMKLVSGTMFFNVVEKLPEDESLQFVYGNITISVRGTSAVLAGQDGAFGMLLTDGTVEATETLPNGREVSSPIEAGTKFEYAAGDPEKGTQSLTKTSSFTLSELPPDVVEEMKNDESLKARIVENVPVSNGPSGPVYTTPDQVDLEYDCNKGEDTMEPSEEIEQKAQETRGETPEEKLSGNAGNEEDKITVVEPAKDDSDTKKKENLINGGDGGTAGADSNKIITNTDTKTVCAICEQEFTEEELAEHICECGIHTVCQTEFESHDALPCGKHYECQVKEEDRDLHEQLPCGEHYRCEVKTENLYLHQVIPSTGETMCQNPDKYEYCNGCKEYFLEADFDSDLHKPAPCEEHYCCEEGYVPTGHELLYCGHCAKEFTSYHEVSGESAPGCQAHWACKNITEWRYHLPVLLYNQGVLMNGGNLTSMCCIGSGQTVACPLCGELVVDSEILSGDTHMHYDKERQCFTCEGERQSSSAFKALFSSRGFEDVDRILEYLHIELSEDSNPPD